MKTLSGKKRNLQAVLVILICTIIGITSFISCIHNDTKTTLRPYENKLGIKPARLAQIDTVHFTTIQWMDPVKNMGTVLEGDSVLIQFKFKNTGVHPLFLSEAIPSCGCTIPTYPEEAIMPGEEGKLTVNFKTQGQAGDIHKSIMVTTNTSNGAKHLLLFEGKVTSKKQAG